MSLLSVLKRDRDPAAEAAADGLDPVQRARTLARRRLLGAVVLLAIGVVALPALLETQPRPIPVDIPIEIPRKEAAAPLPLPPANRAAGKVAPVVSEREADSGRELTPSTKTSEPSAAKPDPAAMAQADASKPAARTDAKPGAKAEPKAEQRTEQ